jgi:hypothetical protein
MPYQQHRQYVLTEDFIIMAKPIDNSSSNAEPLQGESTVYDSQQQGTLSTGDPTATRRRGRTSGGTQKMAKSNFKSLQFSNATGAVAGSYLTSQAETTSSIDARKLRDYITVSFTCFVDKIELRALCFSESIIGQGVDGYRLTGRRNKSEQKQFLSEVYIYGYIQLMYSLRSMYKRGAKFRGNMFRGYAYFYKLLEMGYSRYTHLSGPVIQTEIDVIDDTFTEVLDKLEKRFLIGVLAKTDLKIDKTLKMPIYDEIVSMLASPFCKLPQDSSIQIVKDIDSLSHNTLTNDSTCPLSNSFYNEAGDKIYIVNDGKISLHDYSIVCNAALDIYFKGYVSNGLDRNDPPSYLNCHDIPTVDYLIHHEVEYITGVKCDPVRELDSYSAYERPRTAAKDKFGFYNYHNIGDFGDRNIFRKPEPIPPTEKGGDNK